ncbi:tripartite tricarboxylate transporter substrate binding protein [Variovorax sp. J22R24]|uniref:Bug family tripartite tricarboxylate transporter substrate binding protein n=1 Tax=Variovorax gracilis TaxID=3053502 RepID=UPI0025789FCB|nr:tripartite tricarboxylate transporter substrate binding protein [Variovorax sp. J22R24]MDM0106582.1 tripartite tricarboxylate transporter substrate binding protein [Variovorax sp. J22R24]
MHGLRPTFLLPVMFCFALGPQALAQQKSEGFRAEKPVKIIVPFSPGGTVDLAARVLAKAAQEQLGQPVVVENKPGASGAIAGEFVARAPADGYTLQMASFDTHSIYPHVYPKSRYKAQDFRAVTAVAKSQLVLAGRPGLEAKTLPELIALSRKRKLSFASWGKATGSSLTVHAFTREAGLEPFLEVPYQGSAPAVLAVAGGQVDLIAMGVPVARSHPELTFFGVIASERSPHLPHVPTLREQNIDVVAEGWLGLVAPPGTPSSVVEPLSKSMNAAVADPETQKAIRSASLDSFILTAPQFQAFFDEQSNRWEKIVKAAGIAE